EMAAVACPGDELIMLTGAETLDGEITLVVGLDLDGRGLGVALHVRAGDDLDVRRRWRAVVAVDDLPGEDSAHPRRGRRVALRHRPAQDSNGVGVVRGVPAPAARAAGTGRPAAGQPQAERHDTDAGHGTHGSALATGWEVQGVRPDAGSASVQARRVPLLQSGNCQPGPVRADRTPALFR